MKRRSERQFLLCKHKGPSLLLGQRMRSVTLKPTCNGKDLAGKMKTPSYQTLQGHCCQGTHLHGRKHLIPSILPVLCGWHIWGLVAALSHFLRDSSSFDQDKSPFILDFIGQASWQLHFSFHCRRKMLWQYTDLIEKGHSGCKKYYFSDSTHLPHLIAASIIRALSNHICLQFQEQTLSLSSNYIASFILNSLWKAFYEILPKPVEASCCNPSACYSKGSLGK